MLRPLDGLVSGFLVPSAPLSQLKNLAFVGLLVFGLGWSSGEPVPATKSAKDDVNSPYRGWGGLRNLS